MLEPAWATIKFTFITMLTVFLHDMQLQKKEIIWASVGVMT